LATDGEPVGAALRHPSPSHTPIKITKNGSLRFANFVKLCCRTGLNRFGTLQAFIPPVNDCLRIESVPPAEEMQRLQAHVSATQAEVQILHTRLLEEMETPHHAVQEMFLVQSLLPENPRELRFQHEDLRSPSNILPSVRSSTLQTQVLEQEESRSHEASAGIHAVRTLSGIEITPRLKILRSEQSARRFHPRSDRCK